MSWNFANAAPQTGDGPQVAAGPDLEEIQTEVSRNRGTFKQLLTFVESWLPCDSWRDKAAPSTTVMA